MTKIIFIFLGVIITMKILSWIKNTINFSENFKRKFEDLEEDIQILTNILEENGSIRREHKEIKDLIYKDNKDIKNLLSEGGFIRKDISYIKDKINEESNLRQSLEGKALDINKTMEHIQFIYKSQLKQKDKIN